MSLRKYDSPKIAESTYCLTIMSMTRQDALALAHYSPLWGALGIPLLR